MALFSCFGNGIDATFKLPRVAGVNSATVNGAGATIVSSDAFSVTLSAPPVAGSAVVVDYNPAGSLSARSPTILAASATKVDLTGTTAETALATVSVPGGAMGPNGGLLIYTSWSYTNSANAKTPRIRFGGPAGTQYFSSAQGTSASVHLVHRIRNRNSASSQVGGSSATGGIGGVSSGALVTSALDTSLAQDIVLTGQLALGTELISLESYEVWLLP